MEQIKTGLLFGSFNPVHIGHLIIAEFMLAHAGLNEVWFVVSPQNPLKEPDLQANANQRLEMAKLAVANDTRFVVCDIEFSMPAPSYSIDTLHLLKEKYCDRNFSLIIGSDNLSDFHRWRNYQQILENFEVLVYPRRHYVNVTPFDGHPFVRLIDAPLLEISATYIRQSLKAKQAVRYMLPEAVYQFILANNLYGC